MRLADFILRDMETILVQWEAFAGTLLPTAADLKPLRCETMHNRSCKL
jgi:hypothetical protein